MNFDVNLFYVDVAHLDIFLLPSLPYRQSGNESLKSMCDIILMVKVSVTIDFLALI